MTNIARGTTDPDIASITWIISQATKQTNSVERKIQVKDSIVFNLATDGTTSISYEFTHQMAPPSGDKICP